MENKDVDLENMNFNNAEEDEKIINDDKEQQEEKEVYHEEKDNDNNNNRNKKLVPIIIGVLVLIIIILVILLLNANNKNTNNSNTNNEENTNSEEGKIDDKKIYDVNTSGSLLLLNKYVLINEDNNSIIVDLDGKVVDNIGKSKDDKVNYFTDNKEIYLVKTSGNEKTVYKMYDNKATKLYTLKGTTNGFIKDENGNILGSFDDSSSNETLYFIDKDSSSSIKISDYIITAAVSSSKDRNIYNGKYAIVVKSNNFGIYDVKQEKEMVKPSYKNIEYLNKEYFAAQKNDKYGIIDANDKTILDFDYDSIKFYNNMYFLIYKNSLKILDTNFVELKSVDNINNSTNKIKIGSFLNKTVYMANRAIIIDQVGDVYSFDFNDFYAYGNYLITSKDGSTIVTLYDDSLNVFGQYDTQTTDNKPENSAFFLNNILVLNGGQCFDVNTKASKGNINLYRRTSQDYQVIYEADRNGKISVSYQEEDLGSVTGVKLMDFLTSENNGMKVTSTHFIFSAGDVHFITKKK